MDTLDELKIVISADTSKLTAELNKVQNQFKTLGDKAQGSLSFADNISLPTLAEGNNKTNLASSLSTLKTESQGLFSILNGLETGFNNIGRTFTNSLSRSFKDGEFSFQAFSQSILAGFGGTINRMVSNWSQNIIGNLFGGGLGSIFGTGASSGGGGFFSNVLGSLFGGFRANGGSVSGGTAYMVGERGPELFVPSISGAILPNNQLNNRNNSVNSNPQVSIYINAMDSQDVIRALSQPSTQKLIQTTALNAVQTASNRNGNRSTFEG